MNDVTPKEAIEILSHYTDLGYGIVIEGEDTSKIKQALSLASKTLANGTPYNPSGDLISRSALKTELEVYRHTRNYKSDEDEAQNALLDNILEDIDNAQAVERSKDECVVEWETTVHGLLAYKVCGGCKAEYLFDLTYGWKLCPKCGAKIKGGTE